jgi:CBS domain-containing protein
MKAADVMTRQVITVMPDATIEEAARLMLRHRISGLPVTDRDGAILGIVTEGDLIRRAETDTEKQRPRWLELLVGPGRLAQEYVRSHARKVAEVMTISVMNEASLREAVTLMEAKHVKRLPVIDGGRLVGIVSRANVMEAVVGLLSATPVGTVSDAEIRKRILAEIDQQPWGPRGSVR